ncbi:MAG: MOSC N-terminal beta barrel domain-containing protein [Aeromicrobium sp.]
MRVESINIYPVKSTAPTSLTTSPVELAGLRHDRRWMLVDLDGARFSASKCDALLGVTAQVSDDGLVLSADGLESIEVAMPVDGAHIPITVSRISTAVDAGDAAAEWFSTVAGHPVRLIWQDDPSQRLIGPTHGALGDESVSFADVGPLLLTSTASLAQLNEWIAEDHEPETIVMRRFRPNVVVEGDIAPFAEDNWRHLRIGDVAYRFAEHCDRCVVTTIDPLTLKHGREPIRSLARHRQWDHKTWFGIRIIPLSTGTLSVGDKVVVD